jgi:8-oxo-dGTP diphosphatase
MHLAMAACVPFVKPVFSSAGNSLRVRGCFRGIAIFAKRGIIAAMPATPFGLAVKAIILDAQNRCLLVRRSALNKRFAGKWEWPGGKVDKGEHFADALRREVREETGLEVELEAFAGAIQFSMPATQVVLIFMEAPMRGGDVRLSEEHDEFAWVALGEVGGWDVPDNFLPFMRDYAERKLRGA